MRGHFSSQHASNVDDLCIAATVVISPSKDNPNDFSDEGIFHLGDGTYVDNKCSVAGGQESCTAVLVKASTTATATFATSISQAIDAVPLATSISSNAVAPSQSTTSQKTSGSDYLQKMGARTIALASVVVGILL
jgi:hypothetical protein